MIYRALNETHVWCFIPGIAVDYIGGNLYWTDSMFDRVEVSKLDGSDRKVLFSTRLINPRSIVVHPERGYVWN